MDTLGLQFHHLGLAVRKPEDARRFLTAMGYRVGDVVFDPEQNVNLHMCTHDVMPGVEIIYPGESGKTPVDRLLARHDSGIVYHVCYRTDDLAGALAAMAEAGLRTLCVSPPKPAILFGGERVSFYMVDGFGLIEIIEMAGQ
jgi:catechol 2,3-dioxygenase-like lactoylglutathione lyase family enzyme